MTSRLVHFFKAPGSANTAAVIGAVVDRIREGDVAAVLAMPKRTTWAGSG